VVAASWNVPRGSTVNAIYDFQTSGGVHVYVTVGNVAAFNDANTVPRDGRTHHRGTFPGMNVTKHLTNPFVIAAGNENFIAVRAGAFTKSGMDFTLSTAVPDNDPGSFGVLYEIGVPVRNTGANNLGVGVVVNPRSVIPSGVARAVFGGAVRDIGAGNVVWLCPDPGSWEAPLPVNPEFMDDTDQGTIVSKNVIASGQTITKRFNYIPPGGSNGTIDFVVVPYVP
jgi:hypothetical protein